MPGNHTMRYTDLRLRVMRAPGTELSELSRLSIENRPHPSDQQSGNL